MPRAIIDAVQFALAGKILQLLQEHSVEAIEYADFDTSQKRTGTDFLVLSQDRAETLAKDGGLIEAAKAIGARSVLVINENATEYSITTELGGKIAIVALGNQITDEYAALFIVALLHGTGRAIVRNSNVVRLFDMAARVAQADVSVFINGPTGSGKEVMAKYIHARSTRSAGEFVAINCAAIPENMLEAMLFGHTKGAFTGAATANVGLIRAADGGTLLLDEISEMSMTLQAKLLRAIQEMAVTPLGGNRQIDVDIRVLATSNRNMQQECSAGRFREDLFYRLNVFPVATMPLSERPDDILPIAQEFLVRHVRDVTDVAYLAPCAIRALEAYDWPGNIRELENVIQRALVLKSGPCITEDAIMIDQFSTQFSYPQAAMGQAVAAPHKT